MCLDEGRSGAWHTRAQLAMVPVALGVVIIFGTSVNFLTTARDLSPAAAVGPSGLLSDGLGLSLHRLELLPMGPPVH